MTSSMRFGVTSGDERSRSLEEELEELRIPGGRPLGERPRRATRLLVAAGLVLLLVGSGLAAWRFWPTGAKPVSTAPVVAREGGGAGVAFTAGGYLAAERMMTVSANARVAGSRLVYMPLNIGDTVKAGQVIARLEDAEYRARVERAEADLAAARAVLERLETGSRPEEIRQAEARLASAQAALEEAERNYRRAEELFRRELVAAADRDRAWAAHETAKARAREAEQGLRLARIGPRVEEIAEARARVRVAEGDLALARAELAYTVIGAPFDGTVMDVMARPGDTLFPGEPEFILPGMTQVTAKRGAAILRLADLDPMNVDVDLNETDIGKVWIGQPVTVVPDSTPDKKYEGRVIRIYPMADRQKKTVQVRVQLEKADPGLRPEVSARVTFLTKPERDGRPALLVPKAAVRTGKDGPEVFVVREGRPERRSVTLGAEEGQAVEVRSGLAAGEQVVVEGAGGLKDGDRVTVTGAGR